MGSRRNEREYEKCRLELSKLRKLACNRYCAECNAKQPSWASTNFGVMVCIRCSGVHRNLGTHISKVKSLTLDGWTRELFDNFKAQGGNVNVNSVYEHKMPASRKPNPESDMFEVQRFIRDKYEHLNWHSKKMAKRVQRRLARDQNADTSDEVTTDDDSDATPARRRNNKKNKNKKNKNNRGNHKNKNNNQNNSNKNVNTNNNQNQGAEDDWKGFDDAWGDFESASPRNGNINNNNNNNIMNGNTQSNVQSNQAQNNNNTVDDLLGFSSMMSGPQQTPQQNQFNGQGTGQTQNSQQQQQQGQQQQANEFLQTAPDPLKLQKSKKSILDKFNQPQQQFYTGMNPNMQMQPNQMPQNAQQMMYMQQQQRMMYMQQQQQQQPQQMYMHQQQPPPQMMPNYGMNGQPQQQQPLYNNAQMYNNNYGSPQMTGYSQGMSPMSPMVPMQNARLSQAQNQQFPNNGFRAF